MHRQQFLNLIREEIASGVVASSIIRLLLAAILGGLIGLEREFKHRAAGLRTNMFICFGAAMFTLLSERLAGVPSDAARIAAQIVPGIGFIGAGSIGSLFFLGYAEQNFNVKLLLTSYEVTGASVDEASQEVNRILETQHRMMRNVLTGNIGRHVRVQFDVEGSSSQQKDLFRELKASTVLQSAVSLGWVEHE